MTTETEYWDRILRQNTDYDNWDRILRQNTETVNWRCQLKLHIDSAQWGCATGHLVRMDRGIFSRIYFPELFDISNMSVETVYWSYLLKTVRRQRQLRASAGLLWENKYGQLSMDLFFQNFSGCWTFLLSQYADRFDRNNTLIIFAETVWPAHCFDSARRESTLSCLAKLDRDNYLRIYFSKTFQCGESIYWDSMVIAHHGTVQCPIYWKKYTETFSGTW